MDTDTDTKHDMNMDTPTRQFFKISRYDTTYIYTQK